MIRERITIGFVPTVHAGALMTMGWPASTSLRLLLTGGDQHHRSPGSELPFKVFNNYGPTECTVVATSSFLTPGSVGIPRIGRPIPGATVYLLDDDGEKVPDGTIGEIYIGGSGVGRGYRNLPDATEQKFLADPFATTPGARMYRTGDRGVRRQDGEIEFRGRIDRQIKIRGHRVELDEISSALNQHADVDFAAVTSSRSQGGENQLVAYVLPNKDRNVPTVQDLQKHLARSLPDYMIPVVYVRLHSRPVSSNGKIDLSILPQRSNAELLEGTAPKIPGSPTEEKLLAMIRNILENDAVSAEDSFFLAGGHSLLGMQLLMRLRSSFEVELTLLQLLEAPTARQLAGLIELRAAESRLSAIWRNILNRAQIGPNDNLFALCGDMTLSIFCVSVCWQNLARTSRLWNSPKLPPFDCRQNSRSEGKKANHRFHQVFLHCGPIEAARVFFGCTILVLIWAR